MQLENHTITGGKVIANKNAKPLSLSSISALLFWFPDFGSRYVSTSAFAALVLPGSAIERRRISVSIASDSCNIICPAGGNFTPDSVSGYCLQLIAQWAKIRILKHGQKDNPVLAIYVAQPVGKLFSTRTPDHLGQLQGSAADNLTDYLLKPGLYRSKSSSDTLRLLLAFSPQFVHFLNEKRVSNTVKS
ncbi:hypothetical protein [Klebsiella pneumoniae]|uniref:hypothetical protein n=1 Tax=Klebsiella pneumoniae TaxID=573 RepID=UPI00226E715F|nr:hypothetical protein [Klebsiella pneumoniae]MCY0160093.1 hypothetical protein [Klebsiella pneumoniae]